jgi:hypothetical protein
MGKGHGVSVREGNRLYHDFIVANVPRYKARTKIEKSGLFKEMVETLKREQGRFFDIDEATGRYFEVRDTVAAAKVGQVIMKSRFMFIYLFRESSPLHPSLTSTLSHQLPVLHDR